MPDTNIMIHLKCNNKSIHTDLTDEVKEILLSAGFHWFEIAKGALELSVDTFTKVEKIIDPG